MPRQVWIPLIVLVGMAWGCRNPWFRSAPHTRGTSATVVSRATALTQEGDEKKEAGDLQAALDYFRKALSVNPRHVPAHLGVGDVYQLLGDYAQAAEAYQRARDIAPNSFEANYKLGVMQQLLAKINDSIDSYLNALTIDPQSFEANSNLAAAYMQIGKSRQALPYAERAATIKPDSQHALLNLGGIYVSLGKDEQAIQAYRSAADVADLTPQAAVQLVNALLRTDRPQRARNVLESVVRDHPDHAEAFERMGYVHFRLGDYDMSLEAYEAALRLSPDDPAALNGLGVSLMAMYLASNPRQVELRDRAIDAWRASVRLRPNQPRIIDLINRYSNL